MPLKLDFTTHTLQFTFDAGTSRGVLKEKPSILLKLYDPSDTKMFGLGEAGPLRGLSMEDIDDLPDIIKTLQSDILPVRTPGSTEDALHLAHQLVPSGYPSLRFALETALLDFNHGGSGIIFKNSFTTGSQSIPINGLIWMGDRDFMLKQIKEKLDTGYTCLKLKIGAIDFETECEILAGIRKQFGPNDITLRVDANGAFKPAEALEKLEKLSQYQLHSIEQPVQAGQWEAYHVLCSRSPVPIALDEELIGVEQKAMKAELLDFIKPQFIVLKPSLLGGFMATREWIDLAEKRNVGWWMTSALESNIGLNAIAQFTAEFPINRPQGLGTGQLYNNNFTSPLFISHGFLNSGQAKVWDFHQLTFDK
ncbi:MAG: o-succinylbenzoate synthase [Imperialibacter sp.]